jgi:hypothetical protein
MRRVSKGTQMMRNINDSRHVSVTIDDYTTDWRKVRELQGVGRCNPAGPAEQAEAHLLFVDKFVPPPGTLYRVLPSELHFVDYDFAAVTQTAPQIRTYQLEDAPPPAQGAISTSLDRSVFEAGEIIFRPGDLPASTTS